MRERLNAGWAVMEPPARGSLTSYRLDTWVGGGEVRLALDHHGRRHLLVPCGHEDLMVDTRPSVLRVQIRPLDFSGDVTTYVDVSCDDLDLHDEFDDVLEDVLEDLSDASEPPGRTTVASIGRWRRLFARAGRDGLSPQATRGLFAELWVLRELQGCCPAVSLDWWTGPDRLPHDYELPSGCLEVKGVGEGQTVVQVHGIQQLATHDGRALFLLLVHVADDPAGQDLSELVEQLAQVLPDAASFRRKLHQAGWRKGTVAGTGLTVRGITLVPVRGSVPRLVPTTLVTGELPEGLDALQYSLAVDSLAPYVEERPLPVVLDELCH
jgi:hypothetical protein